jgi:hypothetical protein
MLGYELPKIRRLSLGEIVMVACYKQFVLVVLLVDPLQKFDRLRLRSSASPVASMDEYIAIRQMQTAVLTVGITY